MSAAFFICFTFQTVSFLCASFPQCFFRTLLFFYEADSLLFFRRPAATNTTAKKKIRKTNAAKILIISEKLRTEPLKSGSGAMTSADAGSSDTTENTAEAIGPMMILLIKHLSFFDF